ncbi:MAG TPA: FecR domain-containing protein [Stellaceae bacterium]|nr:FecR domain-containing protein [Stellaceae bacterium]
MGTSLVGSFGRIAAGAALVAGVMVLPANAALEIGKTVVVVKTVTGQVEQQVRRLVINDGVQQNEIIATEADAASEIVFLDGTKISVGPRARITLDKFVYDPDPSKGTFFLTASQGVFRFITGSMAHQSYQIKTPNGTIGVRGTELNIMVCEKNQPAPPPGATDPCSEINGDSTTVEVVTGDAVFTDNQTGLQTPLGQGQTHTILGPGAGGNTAGLESGFHADVTNMDTQLTIAALNAISPAAGGSGDVVNSPLNADPPGQSRGGQLGAPLIRTTNTPGHP